MASNKAPTTTNQPRKKKRKKKRKKRTRGTRRDRRSVAIRRRGGGTRRRRPGRLLLGSRLGTGRHLLLDTDLDPKPHSGSEAVTVQGRLDRVTTIITRDHNQPAQSNIPGRPGRQRRQKMTTTTNHPAGCWPPCAVPARRQPTSGSGKRKRRLRQCLAGAEGLKMRSRGETREDGRGARSSG